MIFRRLVLLLLIIQHSHFTTVRYMPRGCMLVFLCLPDVRVKRVSTDPEAKLETLFEICPMPNPVLIFNGEILAPKMPFQFYHIKNGDSIVMLNSENNDTPDIMKWTKVSTWDGFLDSVRNVMTRGMNHCYLKCMDLSVIKSELRPRAYRKAVRHHFKKDKCSTPHAASDLIIPKPAECISQQPLPIFW